MLATRGMLNLQRVVQLLPVKLTGHHAAICSTEEILLTLAASTVQNKLHTSLSGKHSPSGESGEDSHGMAAHQLADLGGAALAKEQQVVLECPELSDLPAPVMPAAPAGPLLAAPLHNHMNRPIFKEV
jgi:hypothetical protein